jgi:hypothetical protein
VLKAFMRVLISYFPKGAMSTDRRNRSRQCTLIARACVVLDREPRLGNGVRGKL